MELFGIGPMELIVILIIALMIFGPEKMPQIGAKLGRGMREMRKATKAISEEINATRAAVETPARELAEPFKEVSDAAKAVGAAAAAARNPGQAMRDSVMRELNAPLKPETAADEASATENTIAPPQAAAASPANGGQDSQAADPASSPETVPALPEPEAPAAVLAEPDMPVAALPAPDEPAAALPAASDLPVAALPAPEEPGETGAGDEESVTPSDSSAPTAPEQ